MAQRDPYFLGHSSVEQQRLRQQAAELAGESAALFDEIGVAPGARVVEVGCGPQGWLELLSARVGPEGRVVGVHNREYLVGDRYFVLPPYPSVKRWRTRVMAQPGYVPIDAIGATFPPRRG